MNSKTSVMYIHVCHVSCNVVAMFTCTLVRSHPDSRRHWGKTWTVAINSMRGNVMHAHWLRSEWGSVYARNEAIKDVFARCFKKTAVQVCTVIIMHLSSCIFMYSCIVLLFLHLGNLIRNIDWWFFFCRYWLVQVPRRIFNQSPKCSQLINKKV
jgi:hypothetical protein